MVEHRFLLGVAHSYHAARASGFARPEYSAPVDLRRAAGRSAGRGQRDRPGARRGGRWRRPDAVESCDGDDFGVGFAPGYKGLVFVITPQTAGVRLGIAGGAALDDPAGLMQGRGAVHRHVKVTSPAAASAPELLDLMARAAAARHP